MLYTPLLPGAAAGTLEPRHVVVPLREQLQAHRAAPRRGHRRRPGPQGRAEEEDNGCYRRRLRVLRMDRDRAARSAWCRGRAHRQAHRGKNGRGRDVSALRCSREHRRRRRRGRRRRRRAACVRSIRRRGSFAWSSCSTVPSRRRPRSPVALLVDSTTTPIEGAEIYFPELSKVGRSGVDGSFKIAEIPAGEQHVVIRRIGYGILDTKLALAANATLTHQVFLSRATRLDSVVVTDKMTLNILRQLRRQSTRWSRSFPGSAAG